MPPVQLHDLGLRLLRDARLPEPVHDTCLTALRRPGRIFSANPVWSRLFLAWIEALTGAQDVVFLPAAVACECMAAGYDLVDAMHAKENAGTGETPAPPGVGTGEQRSERHAPPGTPLPSSLIPAGSCPMRSPPRRPCCCWRRRCWPAWTCRPSVAFWPSPPSPAPDAARQGAPANRTTPCARTRRPRPTGRSRLSAGARARWPPRPASAPPCWRALPGARWPSPGASVRPWAAPPNWTMTSPTGRRMRAAAA